MKKIRGRIRAQSRKPTLVGAPRPHPERARDRRGQGCRISTCGRAGRVYWPPSWPPYQCLYSVCTCLCAWKSPASFISSGPTGNSLPQTKSYLSPASPASNRPEHDMMCIRTRCTLGSPCQDEGRTVRETRRACRFSRSAPTPCLKFGAAAAPHSHLNM